MSILALHSIGDTCYQKGTPYIARGSQFAANHSGLIAETITSGLFKRDRIALLDLFRYQHASAIQGRHLIAFSRGIYTLSIRGAFHQSREALPMCRQYAWPLSQPGNLTSPPLKHQSWLQIVVHARAMIMFLSESMHKTRVRFLHRLSKEWLQTIGRPSEIR